MFDWLRGRVQEWTSKQCHEELVQFLRMVQGASITDRVALVVTAIDARLRLMTRDSQMGVHIPSAVLSDQEPEEDAAADAALYFRQAVKELQDAKLYPIAAGMMIWLHTYRAYLHPECRYLGRALWKELAIAFDEASRAIPDAFHGEPDRIATLLELLVVPAGMEPVDEIRNA